VASSLLPKYAGQTRQEELLNSPGQVGGG